jgi:hypothetical protein
MSRDSGKPPIVDVAGHVERARVSPGSKSDRMAVILMAEGGARLILRRRGGHPFQDEALDAMVGKSVTLTGTRIDNLFLIDRWVETESGAE